MWESFYEQFITYDGYKLVLQGLQNTMKIALIGLVIGIFLGTLVAVIHVAGTRNKVARVFAVVGDVYTTLFRGTPIVVQLLVFHFVIFLPLKLNISGVWESVIVFGLNSGAYVSEIMRGGIQSVDIGQTEAGRTLGLSFATTMLRVVFPQAVKNVIPTLGNELIAITKDTSVAGYVGTTDLTLAFSSLASNDYKIILPYVFLALVYLVIVIIFTVIIRAWWKGGCARVKDAEKTAIDKRKEKKVSEHKNTRAAKIPVEPCDPAALIEVQHLTKRYGELVVLDDISEKIVQGEAAKAPFCAA